MVGYKSLRSYFQRIEKIVVGIKSCDGTILEDKVVWKFLKLLPPTYDNKIIVVKDIITITLVFNRETLDPKLHKFEKRLKKNQI